MRVSRRDKRRGAAMIEFAIVAIPMFMLIFGCIEFARVSMMESLAQNAAYEAARHVMVAGARKSEAEAEANRILGYLGTRDAEVTVTPEDPTGAAQSGIDANTAKVTVRIRIPMDKNVIYLNRFTKDVTIEKVTTLTTERYSGYFDGNGS